MGQDLTHSEFDVTVDNIFKTALTLNYAAQGLILTQAGENGEQDDVVILSTNQLAHILSIVDAVITPQGVLEPTYIV